MRASYRYILTKLGALCHEINEQSSFARRREGIGGDREKEKE
jgi:hypothetical protein